MGYARRPHHGDDDRNGNPNSGRSVVSTKPLSKKSLRARKENPMNTINNIRITVTKIINAPGQGVLAAGHIEGGLVHVGDLLQVHNHQPGVTARVGRISIGSKVVKEARSGSDAMLLLEKIEESEIHPGDRLLPGEEKELRKTDEESWEKLPERIEPILHFRQFIGKLAMLAFLAIFWIVPIFILVSMIGSNGPWYLIIGFFVWYGVIGYTTYTKIREFIHS